MKYSRAVVYKIDQKKMTVEQIWEVGKDLGYDYFSPVTGITKYMDDKDTMLVFWSTAGMGASPEKAGKLGPPASADLRIPLGRQVARC